MKVQHNEIDTSSDDVIYFHIKRHPIGLIYMYFITLVAVGVSLAVAVWATNEVYDLTSDQLTIATVLLLGVVGLVFIMLFIQTIVYWSNTLTLTNEEIRQNLQNTLFSRKISTLGLANVEDVTVIQNGFLETFFNYGTLRIETAGEQSNFNFAYCGNPPECARKVMSARELYLENEAKPTRRADIQR